MSKVHDNWYLASYPHDDSVLPKEIKEQIANKQKILVLVDLTCEHPRQVTSCSYYINVPSWDGHAPSLEDMKRAMFVFNTIRHKEGDDKIIVLVHCAFGKGRSTMFLCALMVECGLFPTWLEAFEHVKKHRSIAHLGYEFRSQLDHWKEFNKK